MEAGSIRQHKADLWMWDFSNYHGRNNSMSPAQSCPPSLALVWHFSALMHAQGRLGPCKPPSRHLQVDTTTLEHRLSLPHPAQQTCHWGTISRASEAGCLALWSMCGPSTEHAPSGFPLRNRRQDHQEGKKRRADQRPTRLVRSGAESLGGEGFTVVSLCGSLEPPTTRGGLLFCGSLGRW